jgi:hypothetical protein
LLKNVKAIERYFSKTAQTDMERAKNGLYAWKKNKKTIF